MDLRQLRYFVAVVEAGGFRKAAPRLFVTQPALSRALRQLELDLGARLVERSPQGAELTAAGRELLGHARLILAQADSARASVRDLAHPRSGLRIGATAGVLSAGELTGPILHDFRCAHPSMSIAFEELSFCDQTGPLLSGDLDVALVRAPLSHPSLDVVALAAEPRALLVGATHPLADAEEIGVEAVLDELMLPMAAPDDWSEFWHLDELRGCSHAREEIAPVTSIAGMQFAAMSQRTVLSVPASMSRIAPNPLVRCVGLPDAPASTIAVARRRDDDRPQVAAFIAEAAQTVERRIGLLPGAVALV